MADGLLAAILYATVVAGTPLLIAALGELITERAGVLNLGVEGMMAVGAMVGFAAAHTTGSAAAGVAAGFVGGAAMAAIFALLVLTLLANQVASGLALAIFGVGLAAFAGKAWEAESLSAVPVWRVPLLADLPVLGPALFAHQWLVYLSWGLLAAVVWFLTRSRTGLALRAVGESPAAAHAIGHPVLRIRWLATLFGGAMAGLAGAFLSIFHTPLWAEGMVAGKGWIALALVVFATWRPLRAALGAYLFGGVMVAQLFVQGSGLRVELPAQFLGALPYLATIGVLVAISRNRQALRLDAPASLGQPWHAER
ncbi:MAG: ABC transporter permease [Burkholderiaceae bacterium]